MAHNERFVKLNESAAVADGIMANDYVSRANLDVACFGMITRTGSKNELYEIKWVDANDMIRYAWTDHEFLFGEPSILKFVDKSTIPHVILSRLLSEEPIDLPDLHSLEPNPKTTEDMADLFSSMNPFTTHPPPPPPQSLADIHKIDLPKIENFYMTTSPPPPPPPPKGGKKSRKNRKLYKRSCKSRKNRKSVKVCKSRKLYKKFCKSRKLRKSRNVRKTRRR